MSRVVLDSDDDGGSDGTIEEPTPKAKAAPPVIMHEQEDGEATIQSDAELEGTGTGSTGMTLEPDK